jgi:hypothetical protein
MSWHAYFPRDVLSFTPEKRQAAGTGDSVTGLATKLRPVVRTIFGCGPTRGGMSDKQQKGESKWGLSQDRAPVGDWETTNLRQAFWPDSGRFSSSLQVASAVSMRPALASYSHSSITTREV